MPNFLHHCKICNKNLKNTSNSLSLHIRTHGIAKEEYYTTYIDPRTTCKCCGTNVKFINLQLGYSDYCLSCSIKIKQWSGDQGSARKVLFKQLLESRGGGSSLGGAGKRKGVKNKNPYPITDKVLDRIQSSKKLDRSYNKNPDKIAKQRETWANKTDEELQVIIKKRDLTFIDNTKLQQEIILTQKSFDSLNEVFGV